MAPRSKTNHLSPFQDRAADYADKFCALQCTGGNGTPTLDIQLQLFINKSNGEITIANIKANIVLIINFKAGIVALLDGSTGGGFIFSIDNGTGLYIESSTNNNLWRISKESLEMYLSKSISLKVIINLNIGVKFSVSTASKAQLSLIASLMAKLSSKIALQIKSNESIGLSILVNISKSLITILNGSLKGFFSLVGEGIIKINGDLLWLQQVFIGLELVIGTMKGGIDALIEAKVKFDLAVIFGAANGIEILINILLAISGKINIALLAGILNSPKSLFALIAQLGGGIAVGVTGVFSVVSKLLALMDSDITIDIFLATLVEYAASKQANGDIEIDIYIGALWEVVQYIKINDNKDLAGFLNILIQLKQGQLIVKGINISAIISVLAGAAKVGLTLVVSILISIGGAVAVAISIPALLLHLIGHLTSALGITILKGLGIIINVSLEGNILVNILKGFSVTSILKFFLSGFNVVAVLKAVPGCKEIFAAVSAALSSSSNGKIKIEIVLESSLASSFVARIQAIIKTFFNIGGSSGKATTVKVETTTSGSIWDDIFGHHGSR